MRRKLPDRLRTTIVGIVSIAIVLALSGFLLWVSWPAHPAAVETITLSETGTSTTRPMSPSDRLAARLSGRVDVPADLVATLADKDPRLSQWLEAWQRRRPAGAAELAELQAALRATPLTAGDLWRLNRQINRGGDYVATYYVAATAVRHAKREVDDKSVVVKGPYVDELSKLKPFLLAGPDAEALDTWAALMMRMPARYLTDDLRDSATLGLIGARIKEHRLDQAAALAADLQKSVASASPARAMSDANDDQLHLLLGAVAQASARYADALREYERVTPKWTDDAMDARRASAFMLARTGDKRRAMRRLAEYAVFYQLSDAEAQRLASSLLADGPAPR